MGGVELVERAHVVLQLRVLHVAEQHPVQLALPVPLHKLPQLAAHEVQLLAGVAELEAVERAQGRELLLIVAVHLVDHRALAVHDLVMRVGQHIILGEGVHHREGQLVVVVAAIDGIDGHVVEGVVHEAHVPLEAEADAAHLGRGGDERKGRGLLGDRHRAGVLGKDSVVELSEEAQGVQVGRAAFLIGRKLPVPAAVV